MSAHNPGRLAAASIGTVLLLAAVACGSSTQASGGAQPTAVKVVATDYAFSPSTIDLTVGQPVTVTIVNNGKVDHDMKSALPITALSYTKADNDADEQTDNSTKGVFDVDFNIGTTAVFTFTPTKAGTYEFYCDEPGHKAQGMAGNFVVH